MHCTVRSDPKSTLRVQRRLMRLRSPRDVARSGISNYQVAPTVGRRA